MFLIVYIFILIFISIVGGLIYLFYLPINKKLLKSGKLSKENSIQIKKLYILVLLLTALYFTYIAFYPIESFYADEFKKVTNLEIPKSANFIEKIASYPGVHGDYVSCSEIKLSKNDFENLLLIVQKDTNFKRTNIKEVTHSEESDKIMSDEDKSQLMFGFKKVSTIINTYYIGFKNDNQTIFVFVRT
jgi:hypothetical protein